MIYYNENGKPVEIDFNNIQKDIIIKGTQGEVYKINDEECIKFYYSEQPLGARIYTPKMFELLKSLNLENFYKLLEPFYRDNYLTQIGAYSMKYYPESKTSILNMPIEYIIYNFEVLYKNAQILSELKIIMRDLNNRNVILGDNFMTIIDAEEYTISNLSTQKHVLHKNTLIILALLRNLFIAELKKQNLYNQQSEYIIKELFSYDKNPVKTLSKKLTGVKKSIDLF